MRRHWENCITNFDDDVDGFVADYFSDPDRRVLLVAANARPQMVTQVLTTLFDNLSDVQAIHPEARRLSLQGAASKTAVPFHPAAEAFYRSRGVQI